MAAPNVTTAHVVCCAALALVALAGCAESTAPRDAVPVTVAATTLPASAPIYIADEQGFFAEEGLDATVVTHDAGRYALDAVLAGEADFAATAETPLARAMLDGHPLSVVATIAQVEGGAYIVARRDAGISGARDLRGKRVGFVPVSVGEFFVQVYLLAAGMSEEDVALVELAPDEIVAALEEGRVDAISAWPPFTTSAEESLGDDAVRLIDVSLYTMSWNVAVDSSYAEEHHGEVVAFLRAVDRANAYIALHPDESMRIAARHTGIDLDSLREYWARHRFTVRLDQNLLLELEDEARWMSDGQRVPDTLEHIDARALRELDEDRVTIIELPE